MRRTTRENLQSAAYILVGLAAALFVGYLLYRHRFFAWPRRWLPFLVVGLTGSFTYAAVQARKPRLAILMIALLYLAQVAITPPLRPTSLAGAAVYALPVGFALMAGAYAQRALGFIPLGRFVVMGLIVAAGYALMMALFFVWSRASVNLSTVWKQAWLGAKLGAAMGLGFELVHLAGRTRRRRPHRRQTSGCPVHAAAGPSEGVKE